MLWAFQRAEIAPFRCWRVLKGHAFRISILIVVVSLAHGQLNAWVAGITFVMNHHQSPYLILESWQILSPVWWFYVLADGIVATAALVAQASLATVVWRERQALTPPPSPR